MVSQAENSEGYLWRPEQNSRDASQAYVQTGKAANQAIVLTHEVYMSAELLLQFLHEHL